MAPPTQSDIWNYFNPNEHNQDKADCKICNKTYSRKGRTTTSLKNHLKSMHPEEFTVFEILNKERHLQKIKTESDKNVTQLRELKKPHSLEEVFLKETQWDTNNFNSNKIDKLIGEMIALQNLPFDFVEGLGFRRLIQELAPEYNFRGRNFFTDFVCKELYGQVAEKVKEIVKKFDYVSFTSNIWSDPNSNGSLLSLTCHGIAENFDRSSIILKCDTFYGHHNSDIILEKLTTMLSEWNITKKQVHCLIRDEGSNINTAVRLSAFYDIGCTVNNIQLAVCSCLDSQENIRTVKQKCIKISSYFKNSTIAYKQLRAIQDRLNQPHLKMFEDCGDDGTTNVTRWNSTFYMFERFSKIKDAISLYVDVNEINDLMPEEWKIIESCIELLKPFEEATRDLSSPHALISSVIPIILMLEKKVDDYLTRSHNIDPIRQAVMALKKKLLTKFFNLLQNNVYLIATYLDPRYKHKFFTPVIERKVKEDILMMINIENDVSGALNFEGVKRMRMTFFKKDTKLTSTLDRKPCLKNDLAMMLDSSSEDESRETPENCSTEAAVKRELLSYRIQKRVNVDENPLKWWSVHREEFKLLSPIARRFLSTPPASIPREQLFSSAGLNYEALYNRLDHEKAAILLFIKYNATIFNFTY